jgi:hypothetical protein
MTLLPDLALHSPPAPSFDGDFDGGYEDAEGEVYESQEVATDR